MSTPSQEDKVILVEMTQLEVESKDYQKLARTD
jgi:hypothetical protein